MKSKLITMLIALFTISLALGVALAGTTMAMAQGQDTCPDDNGWVKINSGNLSSYPVDGAADYCFKAGSSNSQGCTGGLFDTIPPGGFDNNGYCGLSHWSYKLSDPTNTPEPTSTSEPTATRGPTNTPDPTPDIRITATPTDEVAPTNTPEPTATPKQAPTCTAGENPTNSESCHKGNG